MAISIKQIQAFNLVVMRIAGFLEYLQQFVKLVRAYAYTEGSAQSKLPAKVQPFFTALASGCGGRGLGLQAESRQRLYEADSR